jgi:hypothetical protein
MFILISVAILPCVAFIASEAMTDFRSEGQRQKVPDFPETPLLTILSRFYSFRNKFGCRVRYLNIQPLAWLRLCCVSE